MKSNNERFARLEHTFEVCIFGRPREGSQT